MNRSLAALLSHASDQKILKRTLCPEGQFAVAYFYKRVLSQLHFKTILSGFYLLLRIVLKLPL